MKGVLSSWSPAVATYLVGQPKLPVELAHHGVGLLSCLQELRAVLVSRTVKTLRRVDGRAERDELAEVAGLESGRPAQSPGLTLRSVVILTIEIEGA